jgi:hypothetical protein
MLKQLKHIGVARVYKVAVGGGGGNLSAEGTNNLGGAGAYLPPGGYFEIQSL